MRIDNVELLRSELFHSGEVIRVSHTFNHPVTIFYVLSIYVDPRIENMPKAMLSEIFHGQHSKSFWNFALASPDLLQFAYWTHTSLVGIQFSHELFLIDAEVLQYLVSEYLVSSNKGKDGLAVIFGYVFGLTTFRSDCFVLLTVFRWDIVLLSVTICFIESSWNAPFYFFVGLPLVIIRIILGRCCRLMFAAGFVSLTIDESYFNLRCKLCPSREELCVDK